MRFASICLTEVQEGHTERHLVEQIGLAEWRLRRVHSAELGEIRNKMATRIASESSKVEDEIQHAFRHCPERLPQILGESTVGIAYRRQAVEGALVELESAGIVSEETCLNLESLFGEDEDSPSLTDLDRQERKLHKQERIDLEIVRQRLSIPQGPDLENIQRYEAAIKRDLYRAIDQLDRLQRRRRGDPQPPTVNVNLSSDNDD